MNYKQLFLITTFLFGFSGIYAAHGPAQVVEHPVCPFCFDAINPETAIVMHGEHQAHRECARAWFVEFHHDTCPLCRGHVNVAALFPAAHAAIPVPAHHHGGHGVVHQPADFAAIEAAIIAAQEIPAHHEHAVHHVVASVPVDHCHFCHQALGVDPAVVVELPCHHRFHRLCAAHTLVDYAAYHRCPACDAHVDTIYELFPAMRRSGLLRHMRDAALLLCGGIVGTYCARYIIADSVRALFSTHWDLREKIGMGMLGGSGLGIGFALYNEPRNVYSRLADFVRGDLEVPATVYRLRFRFASDRRVIIPTVGLWVVSAFVNAIGSTRSGPRNDAPFVVGNILGGVLSAAVVCGVREMCEVAHILASYWRTRH